MLEAAAVAVILIVSGCALLVQLARPRAEARLAAAAARAPAVTASAAASGPAAQLSAYALPAAPIAAAIPVAAGDPGADPALMRPALVNLLLTKCAPDSAAYCGTILDLAARGFLTARATAGGLWVELPPPSAGPPSAAGGPPAADPATTGFER